MVNVKTKNENLRTRQWTHEMDKNLMIANSNQATMDNPISLMKCMSFLFTLYSLIILKQRFYSIQHVIQMLWEIMGVGLQ